MIAPCKVSIDGRYEAAYPPGALEAHIALYNAEDGWQEALSEDPTDAVLVPNCRPLCRVMPHAEGWSRVYRDDLYEIYARPGLELPMDDRRGETLVGSFP